jgi:sulfoxide reductase heme-binding subunit YedZ
MVARRRAGADGATWLKRAAFVGLSIPLAWLGVRWVVLLTGNKVASLTADPVDYSINYLGLWSLRLLLLALAVTPVNRLTGWTAVMKLRRMMGLFAFTYATCHLGFYLGLDLGFSLEQLWNDVVKRRFILFGMAAFLCLLPLALTSTRGWVKRLGGRGWQRLHRLAYAAGVAAAVHFILLVKGNQQEPWVYAAILGLLLAIRLLPRRPRGYLPVVSPVR